MPSLKTIFGIINAKRKIKKDLRMYDITKYLNASTNVKRRIKRKIGYESEAMKIFRFFGRILK